MERLLDAPKRQIASVYVMDEHAFLEGSKTPKSTLDNEQWEVIPSHPGYEDHKHEYIEALIVAREYRADQWDYRVRVWVETWMDSE